MDGRGTDGRGTKSDHNNSSLVQDCVFTLSSEFRFRVQKRNRAKPLFGVRVRSLEKGSGLALVQQVRSSDKGMGQTLVRQVPSSEKGMGRTLVLQVLSSEKRQG